MRPQWRTRIALCGLVVASPIAMVGSQHAEHSPRASVPELHIRLDDFTLHADATRYTAGDRRVVVDNRGPTNHEVVVARTRRTFGTLSLQANGIRLDEDSGDLETFLDDGNVAIGHNDAGSVELQPGHYIVFCNLAGHYLGGMHTEFDVVEGSR